MQAGSTLAWCLKSSPARDPTTEDRSTHTTRDVIAPSVARKHDSNHLPGGQHENSSNSRTFARNVDRVRIVLCLGVLPLQHESNRNCC